MARRTSLFSLCLLLHYVDSTLTLSDSGDLPKPPCDYEYLPCDNGACVPRKGWCDGQVECDDSSDESYCFPLHPLVVISDVKLNPCSKKHFTCDDGMCIPSVARCDDMPDCRNRTDEEGCNYEGDVPAPDLEELEKAQTENVTTPEVTTEIITSVVTAVGTEQTAPPTTAVMATNVESTTQVDMQIPEISSHPAASPSPSSNDDSLERGIRYLLQQRDGEWGWGESTARFAIALYLTNDSYFDCNSYDGQLTKKQLEVQLALDLMRVSSQPLRLDQLENYINALLATCAADPKNFYGVNLLKMLKLEVKHLLARGLFVNPLAYLALCNADDLSDEYMGRIKNVAYRRSEEPVWLDIQAIALLTIACRSKSNPSSTEWKIMRKDVAKNITEWQQRDGSFGSMYSTGLVLQALIAANESGTEIAQSRALMYLKLHQNWEGSFGNELDNFYVLPALNFKSLASIAEHRCKSHHTTTLNTEPLHREKKQKKINVHYSLWIGGQKNEIHTLTLGVKPHTNFLEIMELAQQVNSKYKYEVWDTDRGPVINSLASRSSDVEKGTYWTLYRKVPIQFRPVLSNKTATIARLKLFGARRFIKDLRKLYPKDKEHLAFWLKQYF